MRPVYVVDLMETVVNAVSAKLTTQLKLEDAAITGVHYQYGHPKEIINTLTKLGSAPTGKFNKYPLVALFQDFPETKGEIGFDSEVSLHMIICKGTSPEYKAKQRMEKNFKPFLYPIYLELLNQLSLSGSFLVKSPGTISHTKIDRMYWGADGLYVDGLANQANDYLDCIELRDFKIKVNLLNC